MSSECQIPVDGFGFSSEEIAACIARKGLLSMEIELSLACNFRCPYCYSVADTTKPSLIFEEIQSAIKQAKELGARRIILLGGEPMLYPKLHEVIDFIRSLNLEIELFTNGTKMTVEAAKFMFDRDVAVVLKKNTLKPEMQNHLTGCSQGHEIISNALANLQRVGYPASGKRLAISTVICNDNFDEIPALWRWTRQRNMVPYFEMLTPQGSAKENRQWLNVPVTHLKNLFEELSRIDRIEFGHIWEPQPPLVGNTCKRHQFSCVVTATGTVISCVGVNIPLGNIREEPLANILQQSEVIENLRNYRQKIKDPCQSCHKAEDCYGCRGAAYQLTGDYLAPDSLCWHAADQPFDKLPVPVAPLIPHGPAMRLVDHLIQVGEREAYTDFTVPADNSFVGPDGRLDETAYLEIIAQSLAALSAFHLSPEEKRHHRGMLVGVRDLTITGEARIGDHLQIHVRKLTQLDNFGVASGTIRHRDGRLIAQGELKLWQSTTPIEVPA